MVVGGFAFGMRHFLYNTRMPSLRLPGDLTLDIHISLYLIVIVWFSLWLVFSRILSLFSSTDMFIPLVVGVFTLHTMTTYLIRPLSTS